MLGVLITAIVGLGAAGIGCLAFRRMLAGLDPALQFGTGGLFGLGLFGTATLPIALIPGGAHWGLGLVGVASVAGLAYWVRARPTVSLPKGPALLAILGCLLVGSISLVMVLAPSDSFDWDSLAYHLAVPKQWLEAGQIHYISSIHHSNFPGIVDDLYLWGLQWGGESGAKAFSAMFALFGGFAVFGFARGRYGATAGWWSVVAFAGIPLVGWEAGTAYIDVSNGLFVALGILYAAEFLTNTANRSRLWLSAVALGFAAASKYTGLQTVVAVGLIELIGLAILSRRDPGSTPWSAPILAGLVAIAIASPWYVKNVVNTGSPVYPFFYSVFKGKNWDAFSDQIYRHQQQTFGAGRSFASANQDYPSNPLEPARFGAAVLGLAYQPGRYTDPQPTLGGGFPFQSLGAIPLAALLVWMLSGKSRRFELACAGAVLISLAMWFVLSEQSRYIVGLFIPACVLMGGAAARLRAGPVLAGATVIQILASVFVVTRYPDPESRFSEKLKVVIGGQTADEYRHHFIGFYDAAQDLNKTVGNGRVALFDEVFGFLLDVPYFWANPGHSTEIGYEQITSSDQFVSALQKLGITVVYINLRESFGGDSVRLHAWLQSAGLESPQAPYPDRAEQLKDPQSAYKVWLAESIASGKLTLQKEIRGGLIFSVQPPTTPIAK